MKNYFVFSCMLLLFFATKLYAQTPETIVGMWKDANNADKKIEFFLEKDGTYYGKVADNNQKNVKNGFLVFRNLVWKKQTKTFVGTIHPPEDADSEGINITIYFVGNDKFEFKVKKFFMSKTFQFVRIK
jgi:hypothetical protein